MVSLSPVEIFNNYSNSKENINNGKTVSGILLLDTANKVGHTRRAKRRWGMRIEIKK